MRSLGGLRVGPGAAVLGSAGLEGGDGAALEPLLAGERGRLAADAEVLGGSGERGEGPRSEGGAEGAQSLNELARSAGIDKSQMSRVVSGLAARGLVLRAIDANDGRGVRLTLTRKGRKLYEGLIHAAAERNDAFLDCLTEKERAAFDAALDKLAARAREFIERERSAP